MSQTICSIPGCGKTAYGHGLCSQHYQRWRSHGDPLGGRPPNGAALEFLRNTIANPPNDCVVWPYNLTSEGYGKVLWKGKGVKAHRLSLALHEGIEMPDPSIDTRHLCNNRPCINPIHLAWGSRKENMIDMAKAGNHPGQKLTPDEVMAIRSAEGTCKGIGERFGVGAMTVSRIKRHQRWAWL